MKKPSPPQKNKDSPLRQENKQPSQSPQSTVSSPTKVKSSGTWVDLNAAKTTALPSLVSPSSAQHLKRETGKPIMQQTSKEQRLNAHISRLQKSHEKKETKLYRLTIKQNKRDHRKFFNETINQKEKRFNNRHYRKKAIIKVPVTGLLAAGKKVVSEYHKGIHQAVRSGEADNAGLKEAHYFEQKAEHVVNKGYTAVKSRIVDRQYHHHRRLNIVEQKTELKRAKLNHAKEKKSLLTDSNLSKRELKKQKRQLKKQLKAEKKAIYDKKRFHATTKDRLLSKFSSRHKRRMAIMNKGSLAERIKKKASKILWRFILPFVLILFVIILTFSSCSLFTNSNGGVATTTYNADPEAMLTAERMFSSLEYSHVFERVLNFRAEKPGYHRYEYDVDPIGHEIHALQAYLNVKHLEYDNLDEVMPTLLELIGKMYHISYEEKTDVWYEETIVEDEHGNTHIEYVEHLISVIVLHIRRTPLEETIHNLALADLQTIADPKDREEKIAHYVDMRKLQGNMPELFEFQTWSSPVKYIEVVDENGNVAYQPLTANQVVELIEGSALAPYDPNFKPDKQAYANGHCTQYVYYRLAANGKMIPTNLGHAKNWAGNAAAAGYTVDNRATPGAIICFPAGWSAPGGAYNSDPNYGHVAVVEKVENGVVYFSDMNFGGQNGVVKSHKLTGSQLAGASFIHP